MNIVLWIGNDPKHADRRAVAVLKHSILAHTDADVDIRLLDMYSTGATGFSYQRWSIPRLMKYKGYAIYLDSDMLVLGDVQELYDFRQAGHWVSSVTYPHGSSAVSVIDCSIITPPAAGPHGLKPLTYDRILVDAGIMLPVIPIEWNMRNSFCLGGTKLIHYTKAVLQPWVIKGEREIDRIWYQYEKDNKCKSKNSLRKHRQTQV